MEIPIFLFVLNIQKKTFHTKPHFGSKCWRKANVDVDLAYFALFLKKITGTPINSPVGKKGQKKQLSKKLKAKAVLQVMGMPSLEGPFPVKIEPK